MREILRRDGHRLGGGAWRDDADVQAILGPKAECAVYLLPSRTDVRWFHDFALHADYIRCAEGATKVQRTRPPLVNARPFGQREPKWGAA
jgi:hypothetical protein